MTSSPQIINILTENEIDFSLPDCVCLKDLDLKPIIYCSDVDDSLVNNLMNISIQNDSTTSNVNRNTDLLVLSGMYIYDFIN